MEIGKIIAYNLKRLREERNWSLSQLAEMAGVSKVMLSQLEKGASKPTINTVWKITGALHEPYTSLFGATTGSYHPHPQAGHSAIGRGQVSHFQLLSQGCGQRF